MCSPMGITATIFFWASSCKSMDMVNDDENVIKEERKLDDTNSVRAPYVSPDASGEGLPYAPINWPNPGDNWVWRVGHRLSKKGTFHDRYLSIPPRLQKLPSKVPEFQSKTAVERYLRSVFPNADISAFFASFTWEIRVKPEFMQQEKHFRYYPPVKRSPVKKHGKNVRGEGFKRMPKAVLMEKDEIYSGSKCLGSTSFSPRQLISSGSKCLDSQLDWVAQTNNVLKEFEGDPCPEEFDTYPKSMDQILLEAPLLLMDQSSPPKDEVMTDIRKKLSSLLDMGIDCLLSSDHVNELMPLTYKLQNDPCVEAKEFSILKLIQSIPFTGKLFLQAKQLSSKADNFFDELNAKIALAASLKEEYNATKDEMETIKADEASALLDIMDIDHEISNLEKQRRKKVEMIQANSKKLIHLTSIETNVTESLPKLVHEVQIAESEKSTWELKKKKADEEVVEILARFASLKGFSF